MSSRISMHYSKSKISYKAWHERLGHIYSSSYQQISVLYNDVPPFFKTISDGLVCITCITGKMKKAPTHLVTQHLEPLEENHYDISGPFSESLGEHYQDAYFNEAWSSKHDVFFLKQKFELTSIMLSYVATLESVFETHEYRVRLLRCIMLAKACVPNCCLNFVGWKSKSKCHRCVWRQVTDQ